MLNCPWEAGSEPFVLVDVAEEAFGDASGQTMDRRNVPVIAWPLNVTAATLSLFAWVTNSEYGI